jgi:hypothetical protein
MHNQIFMLFHPSLCIILDIFHTVQEPKLPQSGGVIIILEITFFCDSKFQRFAI